MEIRNKFKINFSDDTSDVNSSEINSSASADQADLNWLTGTAQKTETADGLSIEYIPTASAIEKGVIANQDTMIGALFLVVTIFAAIFLVKTGMTLFAGQGSADDKKLVIVMSVLIVIGGFFSKHFFTKTPDKNIIDVSYARILVTEEQVQYDYKVKDKEHSWKEPLKNYQAIGIHRESMMHSGFTQSGSSHRIEVNVIYLEHSRDKSRSLPLQIVQLSEDVNTIAREYSRKLGVTQVLQINDGYSERIQ